jgi:putative zinc finger protein
MKCESCQEALEEYLDGELGDREAREIAGHLAACSSCAAESAAFAAEQALFSRYDRDLAIPSSVWEQIAERTATPAIRPASENGFGARLVALFRVPSFAFSFAAAALLVVFALVIYATYLKTQKPKPFVAITPTPQESSPTEEPAPVPSSSAEPQKHIALGNQKSLRRKVHAVKSSNFEQSDVLSSDFGVQDIEDQETAKHLEQTQNLLQSIRNVKLNDNDVEIDVSYDKALSRRLLNENIVLRRDAEMKAKYPTKMLLSDLEPLLIDIANLPDQAKPEEVRVIKDRVQKTEIVAALIGY